MCCGRFSDCTFTSAQRFKNAPVMLFKCKRDLKGNQKVTSTFGAKHYLHVAPLETNLPEGATRCVVSCLIINRNIEAAAIRNTKGKKNEGMRSRHHSFSDAVQGDN